MSTAERTAWGLHHGGLWVAGGYVLLSLTDMAFSSVAFALGISEANPVLAWLAGHGLFVPAKVVLSVLVAGLIVWLYPRGRVRTVGWLAVAVMAGVNVYHVWALSVL